MTVLLVLAMCAIFLSIDALYGKKLTSPVKKEHLGMTFVPELGYCMQDGGELIEKKDKKSESI
jgi:putative hemolysin